MLPVIRNASQPICQLCNNLIKYPNIARCKEYVWVSREIKHDYNGHKIIFCGEQGKFFVKKP